MQLAPIHVRLAWRPGVSLPDAVRERVCREIECLSWELNQTEALLNDLHRVAGQERAWLMPRIELRVPLYDMNRRFRLSFSHIDKTRIVLVDEDAKKLADVTLV